ncbi:phospholipase D/nuclease [Hypomontagnella monticulosa]|nr:phospholipase D/nuclease [Hypomontagnella monticulosa]
MGSPSSAKPPAHDKTITFDSFPKLKENWKHSLAKSASTLRDEFPDYHISDPECLVTSSHVHSFRLGTGASIYTQSLLPAILLAKREVLLVTCFWKRSASLSALKETLEKLAEHRREHIRSVRASGSDTYVLPPLKISICFSSRSFFQKLFHTWSRDGYIYPPSTWSSQLGLPSPELLEAGLIDLRVKSLFFLPFSVMHPKFLIIDRERAWLPSCNVSKEAWFEGCVEVSGNVVSNLVKFYQQVWDRQLEDQLTVSSNLAYQPDRPISLEEIGLTSVGSPASFYEVFPLGVTTPTILLPSSHHRNPRFNIFPWLAYPSPPPTPLNTAILRLLDLAEHIIYLQTPNLTSMPVIDKIFEALKRGVNVAIFTSGRLMILEQLVTAGTTTSRCVQSLIRRYEALKTQRSKLKERANSGQAVDVEAQHPRLGLLNIYYFRPQSEDEWDPVDEEVVEEPAQSHIKLTIVDAQYVVLGSGNMDRASWFTSQELGIMFHSRDIATAIASAVGEVLSLRRDPIFVSSADDDDESEEQLSPEQNTNQDQQGNQDSEGGSKTGAPGER